MSHKKLHTRSNIISRELVQRLVMLIIDKLMFVTISKSAVALEAFSKVMDCKILSTIS